MILPSANFQIDFISKVQNWHGHFGFAFDLVYQSKPKVLVELGVHYGDSYFCFCQAVKEHNLECKCFGIDNWKGDEHSGFYSDEVYESVLTHNQRYTHFSKILRKDFSDALENFDDSSIDLLHIDGCHTYDSVSTDFKKWYPKVKENGFILLHDTCINRENFGVAKFWSDIESNYPSYNFPHSCGLGIIRKSLDKNIEVFDGSNLENSSYINSYYKVSSEKAAIAEKFKKFLDEELSNL